MDRRAVDREERAWLLECEGMRVESPDGVVGVVVAPLYEFSARWDRPWGLSIRTDDGTAIIRMDAIQAVRVDERRIVVRETPFVGLGAAPGIPPAV